MIELIILMSSFVLLIITWMVVYTVEFLANDLEAGVSWGYFFKVFPHIPRHIWNTLWIRGDEFHKSMDLDVKLLMVLDKLGRERYIINLEHRRKIAHNRSLKGEKNVRNL